MSMKKRFGDIVGAAAVSDDAVILSQYMSDRSYVRGCSPALVVRPKTADQVQQIIKTARVGKYKLVPVSSKPSGFHGDAVPEVNNAVVVDLSGMRRIDWISRRDRVTVIEPGVTFGELQPALARQGLRAMMPLLPRACKSIVAAFMEREPFTVPRYAWDLGDPIASAEIMLGDGYKMRTGGGAGPAPTLEKQRQVKGAHKLPISPFAMDVKRMAQGTCGGFGICTWQALRCELLPEHEKVCFAGGEDPAKLVDAAYRLLYLRLTDEQYLLNGPALAAMMETDVAKIDALRQQLPTWILVASIAGYGTLAEDQFKYKEADLADEARALGLDLVESIGGISGDSYLKTVIRQPSTEPYWKLRTKGDCREIFFLTPVSRVAEFIAAIEEQAAAAGFARGDMGVYVQQIIQGTACHLCVDLYVAPEEADALHPFYTDLSKKIFSMGGYYSRPYGEWSDLIYPEAETFVKYARKMKELFDPDNIMNPEKLCFKGM